MSGIKRFDIPRDGNECMHEDPDGEYVQYDDHLAEVERLKRLVCVQFAEKLRLEDGWGPCLMTREDRRAIDAIVEEERGSALARSAMAAAAEKGGTR